MSKEQCDQIWLFSKGLGLKFSWKVAKILKIILKSITF